MDYKLTERQKELIESFGVAQEEMGLSPASARVNALLTISDKVELSFDEIREALEISKSATSNAINTLLMLNRIGYKTKLGDRKRYFYSKMGQWQEAFMQSMKGLTSYNLLLKDILENRTSSTEEFNAQLKELTEFIEYYQKESIKIIENWKK
ncbi:MAG: transcriptional regulator [Flavobacteriaceae bacterium]|nr:transcriptional regulator [Flavobacteriaceae bacterium]|tara:strand:+ start:442 stop:900 length:459 start_codon:yes stop_codon:yes gene_type:complete